ncbi:MAG: hypothetical protein Q7J84_12920 [Sulfuricaulis sp.]|nr:hypothetical protein [Sulfuricaulis sp.]
MSIQPVAKCWHAGILHEIKSVMSSAKYTISENIVKTVTLYRGHLAQGVVATFAIALFCNCRHIVPNLSCKEMENEFHPDL